MSTAAFPWFERQWQELVGATKQDRLGHAVLLSSRDGTGIDQFAQNFAALSLCEAKPSTDFACGACRGCQLFDSGAHPDFKLIAPAESGKSIAVDQIRELGDYYALKAHYEGAKVALIVPADAMNPAASNALLKILEEPPPGALILLVAHRFHKLAMTIRSRCTRVACEHIDTSSAARWLAEQLPTLNDAQIASLLVQSGGAPYMAQAFAETAPEALEVQLIGAMQRLVEADVHPLEVARDYAEIPLPRFVQMLSTLVGRLILAKHGFASFYESVEMESSSDLQGLANQLDLKGLHRFLDLVFETQALLGRASGLRETDTTESLWLSLATALRKRA